MSAHIISAQIDLKGSDSSATTSSSPESVGKKWPPSIPKLDLSFIDSKHKVEISFSLFKNIYLPDMKTTFDLANCDIVKESKDARTFIARVWARKIEENFITEVSGSRVKAIGEVFIRQESQRWLNFIRKKDFVLSITLQSIYLYIIIYVRF